MLATRATIPGGTFVRRCVVPRQWRRWSALAPRRHRPCPVVARNSGDNDVYCGGGRRGRTVAAMRGGSGVRSMATAPGGGAGNGDDDDDAPLPRRRMDFLSRMYDRMLGSALGRDPDIRRVLARSMTGATVGVAVVTVLGTAGVDTSPLLTGLGAFAVSMGFAVKDVAGAVISGSKVLLAQPFASGDRIAVLDLEGDVVEVGLFYVALRVAAPPGATTGGTQLAMVPTTAVQNATVRILRRAGSGGGGSGGGGSGSGGGGDGGVGPPATLR